MNYSIDTMPILLFDEISRTGNTSLLGKNHEKKWEQIYNEKIERFGIDEKFIEYLELMTDALALYTESMDQGMRFKYTLAEVKMRQAEKMIQGKGLDVHMICAKMSKSFGYKVDAKTTTVTEYYNNLIILKNG